MMNNETMITIGTIVDQAGLTKGISDVKKATETINKSDDLTVKVQTSLDTLGAAKSIGDYKKSIKELKGLMSEFSDSSSADYKRVIGAIGETQDKLGDMNAVLKGTSGEPIENLRNSFTGLGQSLTSLDFKTAKAQVGTLGDSFKKLTGGVFDGFNALGSYKKAMIGGATSTDALSLATKGFTKALIATGIGAIVVAVGLLIANFDTLKESGGSVSRVMTKIGDIVGSVVTKLKMLTDAIGLSNFAGKEASDKFVKNFDDQKQAVNDHYKNLVDKASAAGKDTNKIEEERINKIMAINQKGIDESKKYGLEQTEAAQKAIKENKDLQAQKEILYIRDAKAHSDAEEEKSKKQREESEKRKNKATEDSKQAKADAKAAADEQKRILEAHNAEVNSIIESDFTSDRTKLANSFNDKMAKLNLNNELEIGLFRGLLQKKKDALAEFDTKEKDAEAQAQLDERNRQASKVTQMMLDIQTEQSIRVAALQKKIDDEKKVDDELMEHRHKVAGQVNGLYQSAADVASSTMDLMGALENNRLRSRTKNLVKGSKEEQKIAKESFERQKKMQTAMAIVDGIRGIVSVVTGMIGTAPGPVGVAMGVAAAAALAISTAANVAKIKATQFQSTAPPAADTPNPVNIPSASAPNTIGLGEEKLAIQRPEANFQRVYVTEGDIRSTTSKVEVIEGRSIIGG